MKTLVLYATKHGAAREIAKRIADRMEDVTMHDRKPSPSWCSYFCAKE